MTQTRTVPAAQTRFQLRETGSGPGVPVLLLHGVPQTGLMWRDVQPALAVGRRVLAPDLPGLGESDYPGPYDVAALVSQLAALLQAEGVDRVDVVGHDWGGVLALGLAAAHPQLVRRLCVINAPFRDLPVLRAAHVPFFALPVAPELLFRLGGARVVRAMFALAWTSSPALRPDVLAQYAAAYREPHRVAAMLGYYRAAARPKLAALLRRTEPVVAALPTVDQAMVLWGAADPVLPIATGAAVVRDLGPACAMVTVPGAGHFVVEEAPQVALDVLQEFLAQPLASLGPAGHDLAEPPTSPVAPRAPRASAGRGGPGQAAAAGSAPAKRAPAKKGPAKGTGPSTTG